MMELKIMSMNVDQILWHYYQMHVIMFKKKHLTKYQNYHLFYSWNIDGCKVIIELYLIHQQINIIELQENFPKH